MINAKSIPIKILSKGDSPRVLYKTRVSALISEGCRLRAAVERAIKSNVDLSGADLRGAYLAHANLGDASLSGADLSNAILDGANLRCADLRGATLINATLDESDLRGSSLNRARIDGADFGAANINLFKQDLIAEVLRLPNELESLRAVILAGGIDGSSYSTQCACLAGTLARSLGKHAYHGADIKIGAVVFHANAYSPREEWFTMIKQGDTPETNQACKLALEWLDEAIAIRDNIRAGAAA